MKDKVLFLIIGILIGAIIASGGFILFYKNTKRIPEMNGERPPMMEMRDGENFEKRDREMKDFNFEPNSENSSENIDNSESPDNSENKKVEKKKKDIKEENNLENTEEKTNDNNQI